MPANDVEVTGSFTINSYNIVYKVDGEVYETMTVEYGAVITAIDAPTKEGYTFSGWSEIPSTMPAKDVEVTGTFTVNCYNITFIYGSETIEAFTLDYGATIIPPTPPVVDGYTFVGWEGLPETVPAHDVVITALYEKTYLHGGSLGDNLTWSLTDEGILTIEGEGEMNSSILPWSEYKEDIKEVNIKEGVTSIRSLAFHSCTYLTTVNIPASVTSISQDNVFTLCYNLHSISVDKNNPVYTNGNDESNYIIEKNSGLLLYGCRNGELPSVVRTIGWTAFIGRDNLTTIHIPKDVMFEEDNYSPFSHCKPLTNITIDEEHPSYFVDGNVVIAKTWRGTNRNNILVTAFNYETVVPEYVGRILDCAFVQFEGMTSLTSYARTAPIVGDQIMVHINNDVVDYGKMTLYVPNGCKDAYLNSIGGDRWKLFGKIEELAHNIAISDSQESFVQIEDEDFDTLTYTRTFNNTYWQALYVPFEIPFEILKGNFEVAEFTDNNNEGMDETVIEAIKITNGTLEANHPYLIRSKKAGEKTITLTNATLYTTLTNTINCSSVVFTGTYSRISSEELPQNDGYYALSRGLWQPIATGASLGAFRFYLKNTGKSKAIRMRVIDENGNEDSTAQIDNSEFRIQDSGLIFDLQGRKVSSPTKGIYIVNGKKCIF